MRRSGRPATKNEMLIYGTITLAVGLLLLLFLGSNTAGLLNGLLFIMAGLGILLNLNRY